MNPKLLRRAVEALAAGIAIGINKNSGDKGQDSVATVARNQADGTLVQWEVQKTNGQLGTAIGLDRAKFAGFAEDTANQLILAKVPSGTPVRSLVGAGWSKAGEFTSKGKWEAYVADCAACFASPIKLPSAT